MADVQRHTEWPTCTDTLNGRRAETHYVEKRLSEIRRLVEREAKLILRRRSDERSAASNGGNKRQRHSRGRGIAEARRQEAEEADCEGVKPVIPSIADNGSVPCLHR